MKNIQKKLIIVFLAVLLIVSSIKVIAQENNTTQWFNFRGSKDNIAITDTKTARTAEEAKLKWTFTLKDAADWSSNVSDPIIVNDNIYIAVADELLIIDSDGKEIKKASLEEPIGHICRLIYIDGRVIVPIKNGRLQAFAVDSLETEWLSEALPIYVQDDIEFEHQTLSTLTTDNGYIYRATVCADWTASYYGVFQCIDLTTGAVKWTYINEEAGYYWSGAAHFDNIVVIAGDDGNLISLNSDTGEKIDEEKLSEAVRSTIAVSGNKTFFTTTDGKLYKATVKSDGSFEEIKNVQFAASSTSTPAIYNNQAIVGGSSGAEDGYKGIAAVIDVNTMTIVKSITLPANVQSAPLISTGHENETYAYFTANKEPGGIYALKLGESSAKSIFTPTGEEANYCVASIIADKNGTLYYTNDSGKLFAVAYDIKETESSEPDISSSENSSSESISSEILSSSISSEDNSSSQVSTISQPEVSSNTPESEVQMDSPKTGDSSNLMFYIILLISSVGVMIVLIIKKQKSLIKEQK